MSKVIGIRAKAFCSSLARVVCKASQTRTRHAQSTGSLRPASRFSECPQRGRLRVLPLPIALPQTRRPRWAAGQLTFAYTRSRPIPAVRERQLSDRLFHRSAAASGALIRCRFGRCCTEQARKSGGALRNGYRSSSAFTLPLAAPAVPSALRSE